jgi:hypothetical protein
MENVSVQVYLVQGEQNGILFPLKMATTRFFHILSMVYAATKMTASMYCKYNNMTYFTTF